MLDPVTWRHVTGSFSMNTKPPQKLLTGSTYVCTRRKLIQPLLSQLIMYNCEAFTDVEIFDLCTCTTCMYQFTGIHIINMYKHVLYMYIYL